MQNSHLFLLLFFWFFGRPGHAQAQAPLHETITTVAGKTVYIATTESAAVRSGKRLPVVMALHGSGREALSYKAGDPSSVPFYVHQRDLALQCGHLFVSISNGDDTWGKDEGMNALLTLYEYFTHAYHVETRWVLWASSAGGVLANRMVTEHPKKVKKVIGTFPVYDLSESYVRLASARKAWKTEEAARLANPARNPGALISIPYLIFHGREDEAVPARMHAEKFQKEVNKAGGHVRLHLVEGGHNTTNFALYDDPVIKEFLLK
jgi:pimeloyl-ACP methyl ester carboxylesterase